MKNESWRLVARPSGLFKESDFQWREEEMAPLNDGEVLVRTLYISLDPTNKVWATQDSYMPVIPLGDVMRGGGVGVVEESRNAGFQKGDIVQGMVGWRKYVAASGASFSKLPKGTPLIPFFGALGHMG